MNADSIVRAGSAVHMVGFVKLEYPTAVTGSASSLTLLRPEGCQT